MSVSMGLLLGFSVAILIRAATGWVRPVDGDDAIGLALMAVITVGAEFLYQRRRHRWLMNQLEDLRLIVTKR